MSNKEIPDWSLQLTEQLISPPSTSTSNTTRNSNKQQQPASGIIIHSPNNNSKQHQDEQFENYIDRQFPSNDASVLKNRLSETTSKATTLRNSSNTIPPNYWSDMKDLEKQQYNKINIPPPPPIRHNNDAASDTSHTEWWIFSKHDQDGFYSIGGLLFLFGFLFPPFWWIGSIWPRRVKEKGGKMAERWQKLNRIMSIGFSSILLILIIVFVVLYTTGNTSSFSS